LETLCARAQRLQGQIALDLRRGGEAVPLLLDAAGRLESIEPRLARETYLAALGAVCNAGRLGREMLRRVAEAARNTPRPAGAPRSVDLLLDGLAVRSREYCLPGSGVTRQRYPGKPRPVTRRRPPEVRVWF
jgi:hypothetical protein